MRWQDHTGLFSKYRKSLIDHQMNDLCRFNLRGIYSDMEDFFTRGARIDNQPTLPEIFAVTKAHSKYQYSTESTGRCIAGKKVA